MEKKKLYLAFKELEISSLSIEEKKERCIELYNASTDNNRSYCHGRIYKILGEMPDEIIYSQHLLAELGEQSDYNNLSRYLETKKKK